MGQALALQSRLEIPRANIRIVRAGPTVARGWWKIGVQIDGTYHQRSPGTLRLVPAKPC
jgi:hypothetical protein